MEQKKDYFKKYFKTPIGRASILLNHYNEKDLRHNRGKGDLTPQWIVENIFSKPCAHCGETDWRKIGCNRLDNSKPHTMDNVEPCCKECNDQLWNPPQKVYQYTINGELVKIWESASECGRNGFNQGNVSRCCRGESKTHNGFVWSLKEIKVSNSAL